MTTIEQRLPEIGEVWTSKINPHLKVTIKGSDTAGSIGTWIYWIFSENFGDTSYLTYTLGHLQNNYNPPKPVLRPYTRDYPVYFVMDRHLLGFTIEENAVKSSDVNYGPYPVLRIDGVDEDGKILGEQIL